MSDEPQNTEDEQAEAFDITTATEDELRTRSADLLARIDELKAQPRTLAVAEEILALRSERNTMVEAVNSMIAMDGDADGDAEIATAEDAAPEATDKPEPTDGAEEATAEPAEEAPVSEDATPEPTEPSPEVPDSIADSPEMVAAAEDVLAEARVASTGDRPVAPAGPAYTRPRAAYVAGAGQTRFTQGYELDTEGLAEAWESVRKNLKPGLDGPNRAVVAGLLPYEQQDDMPLEGLSRKNGLERNDELIRESVEAWRARRSGQPVEAHVAAICDPLDIIREIPYGGETDNPFSDIFPQRPINRLGFQYTQASSITEAASGVAVWTDSDQSSVNPADPDTWKPTVEIECATPVEVTAEELTTSAFVDTSTEMSSPERVAEFMHKLAVARARRREQYLLGLFDATASPYELTGDYGAMTSLIQAVHTVLPQLLYPERLSESEYDLVFDPGFLSKLVIDENTKCEANAEDVLAKIQREIGLNVVVLRDFVGDSPFQALPTPGGSAETLEALPAENRVRLVPAGAYIYGATGEQATGWQTDPQLARQNRMQAFSQEWLLLGKHGEHPAAFIDITSESNGARGGCVTPS